MKKIVTYVMLLCMVFSTLILSGCDSREKEIVDSKIESFKESKNLERIHVILASGETYEFMGTGRGTYFICEDGYKIETASTLNSIRIYKDGYLILISQDATVLMPDRMPY